MSDVKQSEMGTRQRLLNAACAVFAARAYKEATVREICRTACANVAAVNYHFGDKEKLYDAAWRYAFDQTNKKYPILYDADVEPAEQLRRIVRAFLGRIFDPGPAGYFPRLMIREMVQPTALGIIADEVVRPGVEIIGQIVRDVADRALTDVQVHFYTVSIVSQCVFFNFSRPMREHIMGRSDLEAHEVEELVEHIVSFCIFGIRQGRVDSGERAG